MSPHPTERGSRSSPSSDRFPLAPSSGAIHFWSANLLVVVAALHLLRVFLTGAFRGPRQFNWVVGVVLLLLLLASNFTGYLLPWDQLSFWAVAISTGMLVVRTARGRSAAQDGARR